MYVHQLPLSLKLQDEAIFDNYFVGSNTLLVDALKLIPSHSIESFIYCYGEPGVGRTHLLQACCHAVGEKNGGGFYLPLENIKELSPEILEALEDQPIVCIDDIDKAIGDRTWEEALFHFYNRLRDNGTSLVVSAQQAPQLLNCLLPDLKSRLSSGLTLKINALSDEEKIQALQMRATMRGFNLSEDVSHYLIHHFSRNMRDLFLALDTLDKASLIAKRRLTIPFVKSILVEGEE